MTKHTSLCIRPLVELSMTDRMTRVALMRRKRISFLADYIFLDDSDYTMAIIIVVSSRQAKNTHATAVCP